MKKRVLLALTVAMATAAMFVSPAIADTVGLPSMVVSATSNNTSTSTPSTPSAGGATTTVVTTSRGATVASSVPVANTSGMAAAVTTSENVLAAAVGGLNAGEYVVPTFEGMAGEAANRIISNTAQQLGANDYYAFDLSMQIYGRNVEDNKVYELSAPVRFVVATPFDGNVYDMAVIRIHNGAVTILPDLDSDPATVTFDTDRFSAYAIVPVAKGSLNNLTKDSVPKTGDELPIAVPVTATVCFAAVAMTVVALNKKKRA